MIFKAGEKVHIIERRYFTDDLRRHFVGEVLNYADHAIRAKGYVWVFSSAEGAFMRKPEKRERVIYLGERLTVNIIPKEVDLQEIKYLDSPQRGLVVTDEKSFYLDVSEFTDKR